MLIASRLHLKDIDNKKDYLLSVSALPLPRDGDIFNNQYKILPCPWETKPEIDNAIQEINDLYEGMLDIFVACLNGAHDVQIQKRYWRITIGPWLRWMVNVVYDRYHRLAVAKEQNAGELLVICTEGAKTFAEDTYEFVVLINHDEGYNLKITHDVACLMDYPTKSYKNTCKVESSIQKVLQQKPKKSVKLRVSDSIIKQCSRYAEIFLHNSGHTKKSLFSLFVKSIGKIVDVALPQDKFSCRNIDYKLRKIFEENVFCAAQKVCKKDIFFVISMIAAKHIPKCWLEGYKDLKKYVFEEFPCAKKPKKIISSIDWYFHESFKLWAASCATEGAKLIGLQHGGNYGILKFHTAEKHEISIVDKYLTWGWSQEDNKSSSIVPCTSPKIIEIKNQHKLNTTESRLYKILYIGTSGCRFLVDFITLPESFFPYHESQVEFFKNLPENISTNVVVRLHQEDRIWEIKERLLMQFPDLKFEDYSIPFHESIANAKLVLCDYLSTTFIECLASNTPTLLFWNSNLVSIRDSAKKYFDEFKSVGILYESGAETSKALSLIYEDIDGWWNSEKLQSAVRNFCNNFAKISINPTQELFEILRAN